MNIIKYTNYLLVMLCATVLSLYSPMEHEASHPSSQSSFATHTADIQLITPLKTTTRGEKFDLLYLLFHVPPSYIRTKYFSLDYIDQDKSLFFKVGKSYKSDDQNHEIVLTAQMPVMHLIEHELAITQLLFECIAGFMINNGYTIHDAINMIQQALLKNDSATVSKEVFRSYKQSILNNLLSYLLAMHVMLMPIMSAYATVYHQISRLLILPEYYDYQESIEYILCSKYSQKYTQYFNQIPIFIMNDNDQMQLNTVSLDLWQREPKLFNSEYSNGREERHRRYIRAKQGRIANSLSQIEDSRYQATDSCT